jgi:hypothetical protein
MTTGRGWTDRIFAIVQEEGLKNTPIPTVPCIRILLEWLAVSYIAGTGGAADKDFRNNNLKKPLSLRLSKHYLRVDFICYNIDYT